MSRYLSLEKFTELTIMPSTDVSELEALDSGWIQRRIDRVGAWLDARLAKRYAVPFGGDPAGSEQVRANVPLIVEDWVAYLVTLEAYAKRGFNPSSEMDEEAIVQPAKTAKAEIAEAANSETGLFELPLASTTSETGVSRGDPLGYTEASPYVWTDVQVDAAADEDASGVGT